MLLIIQNQQQQSMFMEKQMVLVKHYKLWIGHPGAGPVVPQTFTGSFSNKTPTKKFTISRLGLKD